MNRLSTTQRAAIIQALCEGNSIRATCRMTGAAKWTVVRLLVALGQAATDYQDAALRNLPCKTTPGRRNLVLRRREAAHRQCRPSALAGRRRGRLDVGSD